MNGQKRAFTIRPNSLSSSGDEDIDLDRPRKQKANVYDAVAGKVTQGGFLGKSKDPKVSKQRLRPDEVLFRRPNAPTRYEETDYYFAHENLPIDQPLPSGDLLSALHAYVSKLYSRTAEPGTERTWRCMDETALIAFGILMEETARAKLGETGDLAFTEAADEDEDDPTSSEGEEEGDADRHGSKLQSKADAKDVSSDSLSSSESASAYSSDASE